MKLIKQATGAVALGVGAILLAPERSEGWAHLGHSLNSSQRDARMFNNFSNNGANNNTNEEANFPGYTGAMLAFWKGCVEWGSGPHGDGTSSDSTQPNIGDGGANFDTTWQGHATAVGGPNDNIASEISGSDGGTFAFAESSSGGWRIRFYSAWNWADGPAGINPFQADIQGIGCHEYGHALGMAHSNVGSATMAAGTGTGVTNTRSINNDDSAGIQALYSPVNPGVKPLITDVDIDDQDVTIFGQNFDATGVEVWFTKKGTGGNGEAIKAVGLTSTNGGTRLDLQIPISGGQGDVLVKNSGLGGNSLSNAWPFSGIGPDPSAPVVTSLDPPQLPALFPTNEMVVTIHGSNFSNLTGITIDGIVLGTLLVDWNVIDDTEVELRIPILDNLTELGTVDLELTNSLGTSITAVDIVAPEAVLRLGDGNVPENMFSGLPHILRMGGTPGNVVFLWVSGSNEPTPVPGLLNLDIGDFATNLVYMGDYVIPPNGWATTAFQFSGLPFGLPIYWQGIEYDVVSPTFPVPATNVSEGKWLF